MRQHQAEINTQFFEDITLACYIARGRGFK